MRFFLTPGRWWTGAVLALGVSQAAYGQYAPYAQQLPPQQQPAASPYIQAYAPQQAYRQPQASQPPAGYQQPTGYQQPVAYQQPAGYQQQVAYQQAPVAQPRVVAAPTQNYTPAVGYPQGQDPRYVAMNYRIAQQSDDTLAAPSTEAVPPGAEGPGMTQQPMAPMPANDGYMAPTPGYQQGYAGAAGCNCGANGAPQGGYENYGYGGCDTSAYGYGACDGSCSGGYEPMGKLLGRGGCNYWFGGVYGLLMDRDNADKIPVAMVNDMPAAAYPPSSSVVLTNRSADVGYQGGVEFRLGRTFGCGPVGGCGYGSCGECMQCGPRWGVEAVYWQLFEQTDSAEFISNDYNNVRLNIMRSLAGLEVNMGSGYRPANHYWDYAPPVTDYTTGGLDRIVVTRVCVHDRFEAKNLEVNLLRLSVAGGAGGYGGGYSVASGASACGGCDPCAGGYAGGACGSCAPSCGCAPRFICTGLCGVRYLQFDEAFWIEADTYNVTTATNGFLNYHSFVDNNFIGPQIGCNGMYRIGCKWGLHLNSAVGIYANDINVHQYLNTPTGANRFIGTGENFDSRADKTDVSMIGELRLGASYQATCRTRLYGGWRVLGVTGFAQASDQMPAQFIDAQQLASYVNSNGSLILQGLQAGVEFNY